MSVNRMPQQELPRTIGKYRVTGVLGRGSMGVVYRAEDPEIGRTVAVKTLRAILPGQFDAADTALKRFASEARSAGRLRHPNIITIFEVNRDGEIPYIVMDYIDGTTLDRLISENERLEPTDVLSYADQIAAGLEYAHSQNVVHRDIKSSNILIDKSGTAFILDFGVASISSGPLAPQSSVMGTPAYMAPEQVLNQPLDHRADLFGFAVVCFECLTGEKPFPGDNFTTVIANIINGQPLSATELVPGLPLTLDAFFEQAFAKNRQDRFQSAGELAAALKEAVNLEDSEAKDLPEGAQVVDLVPARRRRRSTSNWKRVRARRYSDLKIEAPVSNPASGKSGVDLIKGSDSDFISPWNLPSRADPTDLKRGPARSGGKAPGQTMFGRNEPVFSKRAARGFSFSRIGNLGILALALGGIALLTAFVLAAFLLFGEPASTGTRQAGAPRGEDEQAVVPPEAVERSEPVSPYGALIQPEVDPVPEGVDVYSMTDRQLLGVLVGGGVKDDLVLDALKEAEERKVTNLVDALHYALQSDSYLVRIGAVQAAARLKDRRIVPSLLGLLDDHDPLVRGYTAKSLGELGDRRSVAYLSSRLTKEDSREVKLAIRRAIEKINGFPMTN